MSGAFPFENDARSAHAARLGMWVFLASESMFFAALFGLYAALRANHADGFREGVRHAELAIGTANTAILLASSLVVVLAVDAVRHARPLLARKLLVGAMALGCTFLALKGVEYSHHFTEGIVPGAGATSQGEQEYFNLYYIMTGLHALHVVAGIIVLGWLARRAPTFTHQDEGHVPLELGGLYWHLVDVVWLFLWPLFYLMR